MDFYSGFGNIRFDKCVSEIGNCHFQVVSSLAQEGYKALSIL